MKHWTSHFGFLMATLGAAVGLGNLWKFPYMVGQNGGGAFLILFILFTFFLGLPLMLSEFIIGGIGKGNSLSAMKKLARKSHWKLIGLLGNINLIVIMSFYSIIAGWATLYLGYAVLNMFKGLDPGSAPTLFKNMVTSPWLMLLGHTIFALLTGAIVYAGVEKGLERASKIMMPLLFIMLLGIVMYNMTQPGFDIALRFLFTPDFSKITGEVVLGALGQACFSLATGAGALCIYAAYRKETSDIKKQSLIIATANIVIAILAGLAIFPIVFGNGINPAAGTALIFETLPIALGAIPLGYFLGIMLFLLFIFAALTSSISLIESPVAALQEECMINRHKGTTLCILISWGLGVVYIFLFGSPYDIFDHVINLATNIVLPLTGLGFSVFVGWKITRDQITRYLELTSETYKAILLWSLRIIVPLILLLIMVGH